MFSIDLSTVMTKVKRMILMAASTEVVFGPDCDRCGAKTRLFGIEAHPSLDRSELRTYACTQCEGVQTETCRVDAGRAVLKEGRP